MGKVKGWRRALWWLNNLVLVVFIALILGPYRDSTWTLFLWLIVPILMPQIIWDGVRSWRLRQQDRQYLKKRPITAEELVRSIEHAHATIQLRSDTLNPALRSSLERAQGRGVEIELHLGEEGVETLRAENSPLPLRMWVPHPNDEERRLIIDRTTVVWGPLLGADDKPFGGSENVTAPFDFRTLLDLKEL